MDYFFEKGKFNEDELEHAIIELFAKQGYNYVPGENIMKIFFFWKIYALSFLFVMPRMG